MTLVQTLRSIPTGLRPRPLKGEQKFMQREKQLWPMPHALRRSQAAHLLGILVLAIVVGILPRSTAAGAEEGLIIAVDVSRSMQKKLPAVKRAIYALVDGLDVQRQYHVVLVRFGTTTEQVIELELDGEVARGVLRSAGQDLQANQQWTHFDELTAYLTHKVPGFGTARVSALLYSDGLCSIKPGSGQRCLDLTGLGTRVPFRDFNLYMVRITTTPRTEERLAVSADEAERMHVIEAKLDALTGITRNIVQRIEATPVPPVPESAPMPMPQPEQPEKRVALEASGALPEATPGPMPAILDPTSADVSARASLPEATPGPVPAADQQHALASRQDFPLVTWLSTAPWWQWLLLLLGTGGGILGIVWWHWRFHPITLVITLDGATHDVPVDTAPTEVRIGPTLGCDVLVEALPGVCCLLVQRRALHLSVPQQWQVEHETISSARALQEDGTALYPVVCGDTLKLVTPSGAHALVVDHRPAGSSTERDDEPHALSPLELLGLHQGE